MTFGAEPIRDGQPVVASQPVAQCPNCTSGHRYFRCTMPVMDRSGEGLADVQLCTNPWHDTGQ